MIIYLYEIIKTLILARFITKFEPINWVLSALPNNLLKYILIVITGCWKCCSFFLGLIITGDIFMAASISLLSELITYIENKNNKDGVY